MQKPDLAQTQKWCDVYLAGPGLTPPPNMANRAKEWRNIEIKIVSGFSDGWLKSITPDRAQSGHQMAQDWLAKHPGYAVGDP